MFRGKEKCKILKQIRQNIASENDIPLVVEECHYKGECRGTCPRCESELEYLEKELLKRRAMGKKLVLAGLSAGLSWTPMVAAENIQVSEVSTQQDTTQNDERTILIKGTVRDTVGEPIYAAWVMIKGTTKGVYSDYDGKYSLYVKKGDVLEISSMGYRRKIKKIRSNKSCINFNVTLKEEEDFMIGEMEFIVDVSEPIVQLHSVDSLFWEYDKNIRTGLYPMAFKNNEYRSKDGKRNLAQDIQYHKVYPKVGEIKEDVEVKVWLIINKDRSLFDLKIVSSDDKRFNEAAIETIKRMDGWFAFLQYAKTRRIVKIVYRKEEIDRLIELENKP